MLPGFFIGLYRMEAASIKTSPKLRLHVTTAVYLDA